jgi:hypothetical protein
MNTDEDADAVFAARVDGALSSLEELRSQIRAASQSDIAVLELMRSLEVFWRDQGPLLRQVALTVLESLRVQALEQAYEWREQVTRTIDAQPKSDR